MFITVVNFIRSKLDKHLLYNCGAFLCDLFLIFQLQNFSNDDVLSYVFWSKCDAVKHICTLFEAYVNF